MPPDTTKAKLKRKSSRREGDDFRFDGGHAREIEQKRSNGQISCAECRRLKIKCDKQIPCQSCQRRGCAALCPNGSLATGQGTRFVLAATEHLHRQIANMSGRIRQLEDALGVLQSHHSTEPHPLLRDDLRSADQKDEFSAITLPADNAAAGPSNPPEILDGFGTLSITDHGISRFFGPTGGSECLLMSDKNIIKSDSTDASSPESERDSMSPGLPQSFRMFSPAFPFTPMGPTAAIQELIESHLPRLDRAKYLVQTYFEQAGWLFHTVSEEQVMEELLPIYYSNNTATPPDEPKGAYDLGLLLLVFAIGALVDFKQNATSPEAEHYHQLARASICLQPVLEKPSLTTVQALHLLGGYNAMSGSELELTWSLVILAAHLAQTIGLHRDSAKWGLPNKVVQRRRIVFWDLFIADAWGSLNNGRPPTFSLAYIDCRLPEFPGSAGNDGEPDYAAAAAAEFSSWAIRYAADCVAEVATRTLTAEAPNYAVIMEIDRKVREFPFPDVPPSALDMSPPPMTPSIPEEPLVQSMGRLVLSHSRETLLLYIHRSFFAQAIIENPVNPLKSTYAPSFLAAYRSSQTILRTIQQAFHDHPSPCARFWTIWTFAFSAAIVFGTIITRGPQSPLASNAMKELDGACLLFQRAASHSKRAAQALPILTKLCEKAHLALAAAQNERSSQQLGQQWSVKVEQDDDELEIFAGRTRFVSAKRPTSLPADYSEASSNSNTYLPASSTEQQSAQIYRSEPAVDWASDRGGRFDMLHPSNVTASSASTNLSTQLWRQSQSSDYPYAPPHHVSHSATSHVPPVQHALAPISGSSTYWPPASETSQQYSQPPLAAPQSHAYQYNSSSAGPYQGQSSRPIPTELTGLGLVSQDSRLDERWTSFMRDSGYFDGVGFRSQ